MSLKVYISELNLYVSSVNLYTIGVIDYARLYVLPKEELLRGEPPWFSKEEEAVIRRNNAARIFEAMKQAHRRYARNDGLQLQPGADSDGIPFPR